MNLKTYAARKYHRTEAHVPIKVEFMFSTESYIKMGQWVIKFWCALFRYKIKHRCTLPITKKKKQFCKFWYIILRTQNCSHEGRVDQVGSYNRLRDICQWRTGCCLWRDMYGLWCGGDSPVGQQHVARGDWMAIFVFPANNHTSLSKAFETTEPQNTVVIHSPVFHCLFGRS